MAVFNIPDECDEFLTFGFLIIFLISFMFNTYASGNATLIFIEDYYGIFPDPDYDPQQFYNKQYEYVQKYANKTLSNNKIAYFTAHSLYWLGIPILCFYYSLFKFRREMWIGFEDSTGNQGVNKFPMEQKSI